MPPLRVHQVTVVPLAVQPEGSVSVTEDEDPVGVAIDAQCDLAPDLVEREPGRELGLEAVVHVRLGVGGRDEDGGQARDHDAQHDHHGEHLDQRVAALAEQAAALQRVGSLRFSLDSLERGACDRLAAAADPPGLLELLVDGDQRRQRLGAVPPAELRAGDDPRVLVEPVLDVRSLAPWAWSRPRPRAGRPGRGG